LFDPIQSIAYYGNRGTSGIDGSTSTAVGHAFVSKDCHVLISGDVSFFYDSNAFWNQQLTSNLRVILINNGGGGIFRIIPGPRGTEQLERYFEAKHDHRAEHLCKAHNVEYICVSSLSELESEMHVFYQESDRPKLIEVITPHDVNDEVLKAFFDSAK